ncbi:hypothetical protein [Streptomyces sp. NRRL S-813]|uniref:hypothetical protein n=1 Tax=Streptomyces sp. NRRL S-813 TaxID=1463919 RepID=UPI0004BF6730|nr:hypothetical protein [Streptomyces sp. NRRL S-813]
MGALWANRERRRYAVMACATVLVVAVVCAVALITRGSGKAGGAAGTRAPGTAARTVWTPDPHGTTAATGTGKAVLGLRFALNVFYLPRYSPPAGAPFAPEYTIDLKSLPASPGQSPTPVRDVRVSLDLSAFKGKADIYDVNKGYGCVRTDFHLDCALGDIEQGSLFVPFRAKPKPDTARGPAGSLKMTVRSANAPTLRHTTRLIVGSPYLTARQDYPRLTGVRPGGEIRLTPAFGNKGDTAVDGGLSLLISTRDATLPLRYGNCRYNKATGATFAWCDLPGPLPAGAAYETDGPVTAVADAEARTGEVRFSVWRTVDGDYLSRLPASAPRGSGAPLRLRPVDGSAFTGVDLRRSESAGAGLSFETTQKYDVEAVGFTIKGKVGQVLDVTVPYPLGEGWTPRGRSGSFWVTLPQGVTVIDVPPESHSGDIPYCSPDPDKEGRAVCSGPEPPGTVMRVRIDKRVEGARGSVTFHSDPSVDPDQRNNTAPVKVEYVP